MEYYNNAKPDLIGSKMKKTIGHVIQQQGSAATLSDRISNSLAVLYENYIYPNLLTCLFMAAIAIFLVYRYITKPEDNEEGFDEVDMLHMEIKKQIKHIENNDQAHFNPTQTITKAEDQIKVNYPADPVDINLPGVGQIVAKPDDLYPQPQPFTPMNSINYNHDIAYNMPRDYYSGTYNDYQNAEPSAFVNPNGFSTDFNLTTGNWVGQMTDMNKQNVLNYYDVVRGTRDDLVSNLKLGPNYVQEFKVEPPYASYP